MLQISFLVLLHVISISLRSMAGHIYQRPVIVLGL